MNLSLNGDLAQKHTTKVPWELSWDEDNRSVSRLSLRRYSTNITAVIHHVFPSVAALNDIISSRHLPLHQLLIVESHLSPPLLKIDWNLVVDVKLKEKCEMEIVSGVWLYLWLCWCPNMRSALALPEFMRKCLFPNSKRMKCDEACCVCAGRRDQRCECGLLPGRTGSTQPGGRTGLPPQQPHWLCTRLR